MDLRLPQRNWEKFAACDNSSAQPVEGHKRLVGASTMTFCSRGSITEVFQGLSELGRQILIFDSLDWRNVPDVDAEFGG